MLCCQRYHEPALLVPLFPVKTVRDDCLKEIPKGAMPTNPAGSRYLRENAPGPDQSSVNG